MPYVDFSIVPEHEIAPGFRARFIHSDHMTLAYWNITAGAALPDHAHPHEQIVNVIDGEFEFTLDGEKRILTAGSVVNIPSHVKHSGRAITNCKIIDAFYPVREDYRK
ncbi:MAG: cupin domain-containing protein [Chloroflexi bacterium]|nr:cupin domain-containing protein [Chloroflexota bacterium]